VSAPSLKGKKRCQASQHNPKSPDFECKLDDSAHSIHVDPRTGARWGDGKFPRGWNRRWSAKKYANRKLSRQSLTAGRSARR